MVHFPCVRNMFALSPSTREVKIIFHILETEKQILKG